MQESSAAPDRITQGRWPSFATVAYGGASLAAVAVPAYLLARSFGANFDPVQFRVYLWENPFYFLYLPTAVLFFVLTRLLRAPGLRNAWRPAWLAMGYGAALALFAVSLAGLQLVRPAPINWMDLEAAGTASSDSNEGSDATRSLWLPQIDQRARALARRENRPVLYYLHADWCASCPDFENFVLGSPYLQESLRPFVKVRLDVTELHRWQGYLDHHLGVSAVPALVLRDRAGRIVPRPIVGENVSLRAVRSVLDAAALYNPQGRHLRSK